MKALVTGAGGQDGFYIRELLEQKGYDVYPVYHHHSQINNTKKKYIVSDISNEHLFNQILYDIMPDEIYNFGGNSDNLNAFNKPLELLDTNVRPVVSILNFLKNNKNSKFFQASSSLIFGEHVNKKTYLQHVDTPKNPTTPYGSSKLYSYNLIETYKKHYGVFAVNGILYNHESIRRKEHFILPKIVKGALSCKYGFADKIVLGNIEIQRDWIHAKDAVNAAYKSLQYYEPRNWIISSGKFTHLKYVLEYVFNKLGLNYELFVESDQKFINNKQENNFLGDPSETSKLLKWEYFYEIEDILNELLEYYKEEIKNKK